MTDGRSAMHTDSRSTRPRAPRRKGRAVVRGLFAGALTLVVTGIFYIATDAFGRGGSTAWLFIAYPWVLASYMCFVFWRQDMRSIAIGIGAGIVAYAAAYVTVVYVAAQAAGHGF